jgi:mannose-6-phosphate isomerase-like protein (cupin superfamily)
MKIRRVTTGHNTSGRAVFVSDTEVEGDTFAQVPGAAFHRLWGADHVPNFPDSGSPPVYSDYFPPLGGFRFMTFTVAPQGQAQLTAEDRRALHADFRSKLPGLAEHMERNNPGMHTTNTIDFEYIVSGEVWLELDDGASVRLRPGDTVVQNGTRHAWRNKGSEPCHIVAFMVGVPRTPSGLEVARAATPSSRP